jgi:hypothetical protein
MAEHVTAQMDTPPDTSRVVQRLRNMLPESDGT